MPRTREPTRPRPDDSTIATPTANGSQRQTTSALAITGLVIGLVALLLAFIPIINNFAFVLALVGVGFGIAGIVVTSRNRPERKGKGMAWAGTTLSVLAMIGVLTSQAFYAESLDNLAEDLSPQTLTEAEPSDQQTSADPESHDTEKESQSDGQGTETSNEETSLSYGKTATFPDGLEIELSEPDVRELSSTDVLALRNQDIRTAAVFELEPRNKSDDPVDISMTNLRAQYGRSEVVTADQIFSPEYDTTIDAPKLQPGKSTTLAVAFQVPDSKIDLLTVEVSMGMGLAYEPVHFSKNGNR